MVTKRFLDFEEVAEMTGASVRTLRDQRLRGEGLGSYGFKVDGRIRFDIEEVESYLKWSKERDHRNRGLITGP